MHLLNTGEPVHCEVPVQVLRDCEEDRYEERHQTGHPDGGGEIREVG